MLSTVAIRSKQTRSRLQPTKLQSLTWSEFKDRYLSEVLAFQADRTTEKVLGIFAAIERIIDPVFLKDLTAQKISFWQSERKRLDGAADSTIRGNLAHLRAALNWAVQQDLLDSVPKIKNPPRGKSQRVMKGRPITQAEFESMIAVCADNSLQFLIRGLWTSGLRLGEALALSWDDGEFRIDFSGEFPMFLIPPDLEKGNCRRVLPMAPEFAQMLSGVPQDARTGFVFHLSNRRLVDVSRGITAIGEAAGVVVDARSGKFASAHDLRRSFGERWASRVMPAILMQLMRHESIETTMRFYVGKNAQEVARQCWEALK